LLGQLVSDADLCAVFQLQRDCAATILAHTATLTYNLNSLVSRSIGYNATAAKLFAQQFHQGLIGFSHACFSYNMATLPYQVSQIVKERLLTYAAIILPSSIKVNQSPFNCTLTGLEPAHPAFKQSCFRNICVALRGLRIRVHVDSD
jgi:hypothetical protein